MGPKMISVILLLGALLCGCAYTVEVPYVYIQEGVYACGDTVYDHGSTRKRTPTDLQALQYIPDGSAIELLPGELVSYSGTLYSLSNYRMILLQNGYVIESEQRTCDILDTTLVCGEDRVRLIYQPSGHIRILFKDIRGPAHILLEEI